MFELVMCLGACVGCTMILMYGSILNRPRNVLTKLTLFKELLKCSLCTGFWVGLFFGYIVYQDQWKYVVMIGLFSSGACWLYDSLVGALQSIEVKLTKKHK